MNKANMLFVFCLCISSEEQNTDSNVKILETIELDVAQDLKPEMNDLDYLIELARQECQSIKAASRDCE